MVHIFEQYTILASNVVAAQAMLHPTTAQVLVSWIESRPEPAQIPLPSLLLWDGGLTLVFAEWAADLDEVESVATLGAALSQACRAA